MTLLDLSSRPRIPAGPIPVIKLPASAFPKWANVYICDKCGRDVTKYLHPPKSHAWQAIGPLRYTCRCGQEWLTSATEWDYMSDGERRRRIRFTLFLSRVLSVGMLGLGLVVYALIFLLAGHRRGVAIAAVVMAALPLVSILEPSAVVVLASMWRTRIRKTRSGQ